jgi:cytochrome c peroxidase
LAGGQPSPKCNNWFSRVKEEDPFTTEADALDQGCWPAPEVAENVNTDELGDLGLTPEEEDDIVAFMKALSDGFQP